MLGFSVPGRKGRMLHNKLLPSLLSMWTLFFPLTFSITSLHMPSIHFHSGPCYLLAPQDSDSCDSPVPFLTPERWRIWSAAFYFWKKSFCTSQILAGDAGRLIMYTASLSLKWHLPTKYWHGGWFVQLFMNYSVIKARLNHQALPFWFVSLSVLWKGCCKCFLVQAWIHGATWATGMWPCPRQSSWN